MSMHRVRPQQGNLFFFFQYPGVAQGIDSDINNLMSILSVWNVLPEGKIDSLDYKSNQFHEWDIVEMVNTQAF